MQYNNNKQLQNPTFNNRSSHLDKKINKETLDINYALDQMYLTDI